MTKEISDKELLNELKLRFEENAQTLKEQKELMIQLTAVNEKLVISERLKTNFLSNIRNEINNPITSILELAKTISERNISDDMMRKYAGLIYNETFNIDFQLRNIFASAEVEAGNNSPSKVRINVESLIENVLNSYSHVTFKKNLTLMIKSSIDNERLFCSDPEKLRLVVSNLVANAIQFSNENGKIEIESGITNNRLVISVKDNGCGISHSSQNMIFDRFRQIEEGPTKTYGGHGLGLSVVKALLEMLDGEIEMWSEVHKGSVFTISINETETAENDGDIFSADGNDFMFNDNENILF
jgi:signal transduction histidine kinase